MNKKNTRIYLFSTVAVVAVAGLIGAYVAGNPTGTNTTASAGNLASSQAAQGQVNLNALFSDQGTLFFSPQEPTSSDPVKVTLRAAAGNLTSAQVVIVDAKTKKQTTLNMVKAGVDQNHEYEYWQATIPPNSDYENYYFVANSGSGTAYYSGNGATSELPSIGWFAIAPGFTTPKWAQDGVMYQIFVDRFYDGNPSNDVKTGEYSWYGNKTIQLKWGQDPETGDQGGEDQVAFSGGDLQGVQDKLPYLNNQLGVNILYLNPVFTAKTNHKYGVDNYFQVDPHFGGNQALSSLISSAHSDGDKVILDGVFNHTGASNAWFQSAQQSKKSPYYNWYTFTNCPSQYATFSGVSNLPKLNYANPAVINEVDKIAQYWLSPPFNADGWRLDAAGHASGNGYDPEANGDYNDPINHQLWTDFRKAVKSTNPNALIFGEFWENSVALPWLKGNQWDGSINYGGFINPVSAWVTGKDLNMNPASLSPSDLENTFLTTLNSLPRPAQLVQVNQLGDHDTPRFGERAATAINTKTYPNGTTFPYGGTPNYRKDALGAMLQMTYPGLPTIYYGDEYGMMGGGTNDAGKRWPFNWSQTGNSLFNVYQTLIAMRKADSALVDGSFMPLVADDTNDVFGFARVDANQRIIILLNDSNKPVTEKVNASATGALYGSTFKNVTPLLPGVTGDGGSGQGGNATLNGKGNIEVTIPANYGVILTQKGGPLY
ncbi:glycoside hydrolase family 13 protein [Alicyclobacillus ferrooxydans]|uniref:glycoside hydrolase family 13 protein n=1 Tax=Alicyclobacillus ferrooxydans TaxID=471514 RepID=UPI0006D5524A|nr:glycoside hydrolase family 13 protein [Alicyclobacillus ferrooxydans]